MTAFPDESSVERHALRFLDRTLPKEEWTHEGHFAAALWLLRNRADLAGPDEMRELIMRYNDATGKPNTDSEGYHHTITRASMRAAASHLIALPPGEPLHEVLRSLMRSARSHSARRRRCSRSRMARRSCRCVFALRGGARCSGRVWTTVSRAAGALW